MKRSPLRRRSPLKQGSTLRRTAPIGRSARLRAARKADESNPLRDEFKTVRDGICRVCKKRGLVRRHHVVYEAHLRREHGDCWDLRNGMWVGVGSEAGMLATCDCHERHHNASARITINQLPEAAVGFAIELLGFDRAALYLATYYAPGELRP